MTGLKERLRDPQWKTECLPDPIAQEAGEVITGFHSQGDVAPKYRAHALAEFWERDGFPPRVAKNGERRSVEQTRLDRVWPDLAERFDKSEPTIRNCVTGVYADSGEYEYKTTRLRKDFKKILEQAEKNQTDS